MISLTFGHPGLASAACIVGSNSKALHVVGKEDAAMRLKWTQGNALVLAILRSPMHPLRRTRHVGGACNGD